MVTLIIKGDTSLGGHFEMGTLYCEDTLLWGHNIVRTLCYGDTS